MVLGFGLSCTESQGFVFECSTWNVLWKRIGNPEKVDGVALFGKGEIRILDASRRASSSRIIDPGQASRPREKKILPGDRRSKTESKRNIHLLLIS
jgi:hypothetical protein